MNWREKYPIILLGVYLVIWIVLGISPNYRSIWVDENILVVLFVLILVVSFKKFRFSNLSYSLLFVFMVLHAVGGHYSYAEMPLFDLIKEEFDLSRNHYDRLVHFLFGVLFFFPIYDILVRIFNVPENWRGLFLAFMVVVALKGSFEAIEYGYVWVKQDDLTVAKYLGEQGDAFDAVKDIGLGIIGGLVGWITFWRGRVFNEKG